MNEVGALIRRLREQAGLKQRELAERLGTQPSRISNYERGERYPSTTDAFALGRFFGRDAVDFLDPRRTGVPTSVHEGLPMGRDLEPSELPGWPRLLSTPLAAAYVSLPVDSFEAQCGCGKLFPAPRKIAGHELHDRFAIDRAIARGRGE